MEILWKLYRKMQLSILISLSSSKCCMRCIGSSMSGRVHVHVHVNVHDHVNVRTTVTTHRNVVVAIRNGLFF